MSKGVIIIEQTGILTLVGAIAVILALIAFGKQGPLAVMKRRAAVQRALGVRIVIG